MAKRKPKGGGNAVAELPSPPKGLPGLRVAVNRKQLLAALQVAAQVTGSPTVNPALAGVRLIVEPELRVESTDHEAWVSIPLPSAEIFATGGVTVRDPNRLISLLSGESIETVDLSGNPDDGLRIALDGSRFDFECLEADGFEAPPAGDNVHVVEVKAGDLAGKLRSVLPMSGRPAIKRGWQMITDGVHFAPVENRGVVQIAATNLVRLGTTEIEAHGIGGGADDFDGVIPSNYARLMANLAGEVEAGDLCELSFSKTRLELTVGEVRLAVRFLEGKFPNEVEPLSGFQRFAEVLREPLLSAIRGVDTLVGLDGNADVTIEGSQITVSVETADKGIGSAWVPAGGFQGTWSAWVRIADLARALAASPSDMVQIGPSSTGRLAVRAGDVSYQFDTAVKE